MCIKKKYHLNYLVEHVITFVHFFLLYFFEAMLQVDIFKQLSSFGVISKHVF